MKAFVAAWRKLAHLFAILHACARDSSKADCYSVDCAAKVAGPVPVIDRRRVLSMANASDLVIRFEQGVGVHHFCI